MQLGQYRQCREMSQKEFWIHAYIASMQRVGWEEAIKEADAALIACNERWNELKIPPIASVHFAHDYPIGGTAGLIDP